MDENYLDNLLNEISLDKELDHKIEDELDSQMLNEKHLKQQSRIDGKDAFSMDLEQDAGQIKNAEDLRFSEEQIDELDQLEHLADMDIGNVDFSDIDFEDVDVTKLDDIQQSDLDDILKEFEGDLEIDDFYNKTSSEEPQSDKSSSEAEYSPDMMEEISSNDLMNGHNDNLNEDTFNTDQFLDSLLGESNHTEGNNQLSVELENSNGSVEDTLDKDNVKDNLEGEEDILNDLISSFDINDMMSDGNQGVEANDKLQNASGMNIGKETEDVSDEEKSIEKKKNKFMQILFGDPDEDDELSEEELAEIEAKKAAKKAKKQAAKEAKKEKAAIAKEKKTLKTKQNNEKKKLKAERRSQQQALEETEPEKKLNKCAVVFIFSIFLGGIFILYIGINHINYAQAIEKATNYFSGQKYRRAYDEIVGIDVQEKDKELKDRIYTVMYVERLYESYENNIQLEREEKALDALLQGVDKYYEHYEEAGELGIAKDLDYSLGKIQEVLSQRYGISVEQAVTLNQLESVQYVQTVKSYVEKVSD